MTATVIDNTLAETASEDDAVAEATERCLKAEQAFRDGSIGLTQLYEAYETAIASGAYEVRINGKTIENSKLPDGAVVKEQYQNQYI